MRSIAAVLLIASVLILLVGPEHLWWWQPFLEVGMPSWWVPLLLAVVGLLLYGATRTDD